MIDEREAETIFFKAYLDMKKAFPKRKWDLKSLIKPLREMFGFIIDIISEERLTREAN
jgi:hypothetical protein